MACPREMFFLTLCSLIIVLDASSVSALSAKRTINGFEATPGICGDLEKKSHPRYPSKFKMCMNDMWITIPCAKNQLFDCKKLRCIQANIAETCASDRMDRNAKRYLEYWENLLNEASRLYDRNENGDRYSNFKPPAQAEEDLTPRSSTCLVKECHLPDCLCEFRANSTPPYIAKFYKPVTPKEKGYKAPMFVLLSFDDSVQSSFMADYQQFGLLSSSNGCPLKATFFVSHNDTDYASVRKLYDQGHEIGVHSVSHRTPETFWDKMSYRDLDTEYLGQRNILAEKAKIPIDELRGLRAPYLRISGNDQFRWMAENNFLYDYSIFMNSVQDKSALTQKSSWPFTAGWGSENSGNSHPPNSKCGRQCDDVWIVPMNLLYSSNRIHSMVDSYHPRNYDEAYSYLMSSFYEYYYNENRFPFSLAMHSAWWRHHELGYRFQALYDFLKDISSKYDDVLFVTPTELIEYIKSGTISGRALPFECERREEAKPELPHDFNQEGAVFVDGGRIIKKSRKTIQLKRRRRRQD